MNTQEMIQRYKIALKIDEHGQPTGNLVVYRADKAALAAIKAAKPEISVPLYERFCKDLSRALGKEIGTGTFGADMKVELLNDGPVTICMDTKNKE